MQYDLEIGGRVRHIVVSRAGSRFLVAVDGRAWDVDAEAVSAQAVSLLVRSGQESSDRSAGQMPNASYEVSVAPDPASPGGRLVYVGTRLVPVAMNGRRHRAGLVADAGSGPQQLVSPMPGRIVRVLVRAGDAVTARQPLVVVEAMKMENEVRASRPGTIRHVHVEAGASVDAGAPLVLID